MTESGQDENMESDGPSPMRQARTYVHRTPALGAVAVELLFVLLLCNQWMVDHVVVPWESSASPIRQGLAPGLGAFSWSFTPVLSGYNWLWAGQIAHLLVWLLVTFVLVRISLRTREIGARFIATIGSVVIAAIAALVAQRLVVYPDLARLQTAATQTHQAGPGLVPWLFFGTVPGGSVTLVVIVATLAAITSGRLAISGEEDGDGLGDLGDLEDDDAGSTPVDDDRGLPG
ncbi:MAG: hypothetical protein ABI775_04000 [Pseudonocardiales bacterium]|nr:hypothetical protein [Actinomycetota bacterium]